MEDKKKKEDLILPPGLDPNLTKDELELVMSFFVRNQFGPSIAPLICKSDCPLKESCILFKLGKNKIGEQCPIEAGEAVNWFNKYAEAIQLSGDDYVSAVMLQEAVNWMIMEQRYQHEFRKNPKASEKTMRGVDKEGNPIFDVKPNPVLKSLKEASMRKHAIYRALAATKLEKAKLKTKTQDEPTRVAARLQKQLEGYLKIQEQKLKLLESRGGENEETIEAEYEVKEAADVPPPPGDEEARGTDAGDE